MGCRQIVFAPDISIHRLHCLLLPISSHSKDVQYNESNGYSNYLLGYIYESASKANQEINIVGFQVRYPGSFDIRKRCAALSRFPDLQTSRGAPCHPTKMSKALPKAQAFEASSPTNVSVRIDLYTLFVFHCHAGVVRVRRLHFFLTF